MTFLQGQTPRDRYVYLHLRKDDLSLFYVGKGSAWRINSSNTRNEKWRKVVSDAGGFVAIKVIDGMTDSEAYTAEKILMDSLPAHHKHNLCNILPCGKGGVSPPPETRLKQRNAKLGKKASIETRMKMTASRTGKSCGLGLKRSDEHRKNISEALKNRIRKKETGDKISKAKMGHLVSEDTRTKISLSKKGVPWTDEQREKMRVARLNKVKYGHVPSGN
jgi:hypothetical protein